MFHWLHHLFNPHCQDCNIQKIENAICQSCETLKMQLAICNSEKRQMLESILSFNKPTEPMSTTPATAADLKEVNAKMMTWNVRKQMLEAEDRKLALVMAERRKSEEEAKKQAAISKLEEEVGIKEVADA